MLDDADGGLRYKIVRVRRIRREIVRLALHASDHDDDFADVSLHLTRRMRQRHKHFLYDGTSMRPLFNRSSRSRPLVLAMGGSQSGGCDLKGVRFLGGGNHGAADVLRLVESALAKLALDLGGGWAAGGGTAGLP